MSDFFIKAKNSKDLGIRAKNGSKENQEYKIKAFSGDSLILETDENIPKNDILVELAHRGGEESIEVKGEVVGSSVDHTNFYVELNKVSDRVRQMWDEFFEAQLHNMQAWHLMTHNPYSVSKDTPTEDICRLLKEKNMGAILVTDKDGGLEGIFTERDIMKKCLEPGFFQDPVEKHMTSRLTTIEETASAEEVYMKFKDAHFRHLPVVTNNKLVGIISIKDLLKFWSVLLEVQRNNIKQKYEKTMSVIVHDLRSPIYAIRSINELLNTGQETADSYLEMNFPQLIDDSCNTMITLIDDLLDISEANANVVKLETQPVNLAQVITKVKDTFNPTAKGKNINVDLKLDESIGELALDKRRFTQVIQNLLSNAIKYSNKDSNVEVYLQKTASSIEFAVVDHGQGIKKEEQGKVFDELCKISSKPTDNEPSTGLGLSIVKKLVEAHGGRIDLKSTPNVETRFTVYLPLDIEIDGGQGDAKAA